MFFFFFTVNKPVKKAMNYVLSKPDVSQSAELHCCCFQLGECKPMFLLTQEGLRYLALALQVQYLSKNLI